MRSTTETETQTAPLWINGKIHAVGNATTFSLISSATGETTHHAIPATVVDAHLACETSEALSKSGCKTTHVHRRQTLSKAAAALRCRADDVTSYQVAETSCPPQIAKLNIMQAVEYIEEIVSSMTEVRGTIAQRPSDRDRTALGRGSFR